MFPADKIGNRIGEQAPRRSSLSVQELEMRRVRPKDATHSLALATAGRLRRDRYSDNGGFSVSLVICITTLSLLLLGSVCAQAREESSPAIYQTAASIHALSQEQAQRAYPAHLLGVVTQSLNDGFTLQDRTGGIWIYFDHPEQFMPGDEIDVEGTAKPGLFAPVVQALSVRKLGRAPLPKPIKVSFKQISNGNRDCQYVSVTGMVRSVGIRKGASNSQKIWMRIAVDDGIIDATFPAADADLAAKLIDAFVRIDAPTMCSKNQKRQIIAANLSVPSMRNLTVLRPPPPDIFATPLIPVGKLMQYLSGTDYYHRVRVAGVATYYKPGESLILEDRGQALLVKTAENKTIQPGDRVEAVGFPAPADSGPILQDAVLRRTASGAALQPALVKIAEISSGTMNNTLVSVDGHLVRRIHEPFREVLLLQDESNILLAELNQSGGSDPFPELREGSKIRISGISVLEVEGMWNYGLRSAYDVRSKLLLRAPTDVEIIEPPTWWTTRHVLYIAGVLGILVLVFLAQIIVSRIEKWRLEAVLEERERLAHEIHDTLAQSFAGIGFQLQAILKEIPRDMPSLKEQVNLARDLVRHSHKEARRSIEPLQPNSLQETDLLLSLENAARNMVQGGSVNVVTSCSGNPRSLSLQIADALLRIGQEAIANAVRHADPSNLTIALHYEDNTIQLKIQDDGNGFVKSGDLLGFGLRGMRKRAASISGRLDIITGLGQGTCVAITVPLPPVMTLSNSLKRTFRYASGHIFHVEAKQRANTNTDR
ncbi:sensor histidine kinase [Terriglobus albidus]|uniref:Sensor histidine kinase n=1 Tax=Terriglobus albidus TaxID=1592106 RepID=A0A5B9EE36_9BACT|nr:sensor histidine kinase [Terriglobus albidus]